MMSRRYFYLEHEYMSYDETQRKEHEREGDQEETRHRVLACVPSEYR
jgi:hypothetical protein